MSNNDPIPADVWDAARSEIDRSRGYEAIAVVARAIMAERERCAVECEKQAKAFLSPQYAFNQPLGSFLERFACGECADAIRKGAP